jgi:hypothetical protein
MKISTNEEPGYVIFFLLNFMVSISRKKNSINKLFLENFFFFLIDLSKKIKRIKIYLFNLI